MIKSLRPRLAEAGKIKIGGLGPSRKSRSSGKTFRPPVKYDHFKITGTTRDENGDLIPDVELMEAVAKISKDPTDDKIRAIPIVLHSDSIDGVFPTSYALYTGKKCFCRGDGERATRREIKDNQYMGAEKTIDCPCDFLKSRRCKPNGKLYCSIAAPGASVAGAVHVWRTTSLISIEQLIGSLAQIKSICGTLRGVPLWLMVKPVTVEPPESGPITVWCCHIELRAADIEEIQRKALQSARTRALLEAADENYRKILTLPGVNETDTEQAEIEAEFYSEDDPAEPVDPKAPAGPEDVASALRTEQQKPGVPYVDDDDLGEGEQTGLPLGDEPF